MKTVPRSSSSSRHFHANLPFVSHASMAKSPRSKPKPHVFLCCFGFSNSGKNRRFKPLKPGHAAASQRKRLFSWTRLQAKPPPVAKTITVSGISSELRSTFPAERCLSKPDSHRLTSGSTAPTTADEPPNEDLTVAVPVETNRAGEGKPEEVKHDSIAEKIILENCEHSDVSKKPVGQSQTRFSLTRKLDSFRSGRFTQPASLIKKKDPKSTSPTPAISHSLSFPPPNPTRKIRAEDPLTSMRVLTSSGGVAGGETGKKYRSAAGMSIMIITLAIMVLWGRLCAILCTAAWLFIVTSLRSIVEESDKIGSSEPGSFSQGVKKKLFIFKRVSP